MPKLLVQQRGPITRLTLNRPEVHNCVDAEAAVLLAQAKRRAFSARASGGGMANQ